MNIKNILVLQDNYIWIIYDLNGFAVIIDPGHSELIIKEIEKEKLKPVAILLTHNHLDHVNGIFEIMKKYPNIDSYGPKETEKFGIKNIVTNGMKIKLLNRLFDVLFTPGHTAGHVIYYTRPYLFCGDTLFSGGCGRVENNEYLALYYSIKKILNFPNQTVICCAHEYTISNLVFSMSILPNDTNIKKYYEKIKNKKCTLPSSLKIEKKINIFLRIREKKIKKLIGLKKRTSDFQCFLRLRIIKNFY